MKFIIATGLLLSTTTPALAGPYLNFESESKFDGLDSTGTIIRNDLGYEDALNERVKWYIQGGPALVMPDDGTTTTEAAGKAGLKVELTDRLGIYGEVKGITQDQMDLGEAIKVSTKAGVKFRF